jgi:hypothetical protein
MIVGQPHVKCLPSALPMRTVGRSALMEVQMHAKQEKSARLFGNSGAEVRRLRRALDEAVGGQEAPREKSALRTRRQAARGPGSRGAPSRLAGAVLYSAQEVMIYVSNSLILFDFSARQRHYQLLATRLSPTNEANELCETNEMAILRGSHPLAGGLETFRWEKRC